MNLRSAWCWAATLMLALAAAPARGAEPDYSEYQKLLDRFLHVVTRPGQPIQTRFDYVDLDGAPGAYGLMGRARRAMLAVPPDSMSARERTAWGINLYNLRVIELVEANLRDPRTKQVIPGVKMLSPTLPGFFEQDGLRVGDGNYTLDAFERVFLFHEFDSTGRPPKSPDVDPRVHFALVCAAVGCPSLMPRAYRADSLDQQLDFAVRNALADPRHLRWNPANNRVLTSELFRSYRRDFEPEGPIAFIKRYGPASIVQVIKEKNLQDLEQDIPWDWSLNRYVPASEEPAPEKPPARPQKR
jgi:hypothetical protein